MLAWPGMAAGGPSGSVKLRLCVGTIPWEQACQQGCSGCTVHCFRTCCHAAGVPCCERASVLAATAAAAGTALAPCLAFSTSRNSLHCCYGQVTVNGSGQWRQATVGEGQGTAEGTKSKQAQLSVGSEAGSERAQGSARGG